MRGNNQLVFAFLSLNISRDDISNNINYRGLIGISKDVHVVSGTELTINSNAVVFLLNDATLIVDYC